LKLYEEVLCLKKLENKIKTSIWFEEAAGDNSFYAEKSYCHGYDFYNNLLGRLSWTELVFLHLIGELPTPEQNNHFNLLLISVMNPGPRDLSNRAAMSAAIGGCPVGGALMSGFSCSMGELEGGLAVEITMHMLQEIGQRQERGEVIPSSYQELLKRYGNNDRVPGFGLLNAEQDTHAIRLLQLLKEKGWDGHFINLLLELESVVAKSSEERARLYGVFAASLLDLGFQAEHGHGLFMISGGAGMLGFIYERYKQKWYEYPTWYSDVKHVYKKGQRKD
jgi:citrate synthase